MRRDPRARAASRARARRSFHPPIAPLEPGAHLTRGLGVVRRLGVGAQGEVYEVMDLVTAKRWAVKLLFAHLEGVSGAWARLRREAELAASIRHPNLVESYGLETALDGRGFLRMELLVGRTLAELEHPLSIAYALELFAQIADALTALHAHGIVHRDLKPRNVFVLDRDRGPRVKLMDLGIAKTDDRWNHTKLTMPGALVGTPLYMAPEQILEPDEVTPAADVYALGLLLHELLTGRPPFEGKTIIEVLERQLKEPMPDPRKLRPELPEPLVRVLARALEKEPSRRFGSVARFVRTVRAAEADAV